MKKSLIALLLTFLAACMASAEPGAKAENEFYTPDSDKKGLDEKVPQQSGLPHVLILGDSISIGYTPFVIKGLKDKANVKRAKANCGDTNRGLKSLKQWLGKTQWDVIHFNFGLHDLCYRHPESKVYGKRDKERGKQAVSPELYEKNLEKIVEELKKTGAKLIWASTTVIPEGEAGRLVGDDMKYNKLAEKVMQKHGIKINDLHATSVSFEGKLFTKPKDVHFTKEGSKKLGQAVIDVITKALE